MDDAIDPIYSCAQMASPIVDDTCVETATTRPASSPISGANPWLLQKYLPVELVRTAPLHVNHKTLAKASMLDAANIRRKECVDSLRREKMAEAKAQKQLESELERAREICATTTRATQQVSTTN